MMMSFGNGGGGGGMGGLGMLGGGGGGGLMQLAGACRDLIQNDAKVAEIQRDCLPGGVLSMGALQDCPAVPSGCRSALKSASPETLASAMSILAPRMPSPAVPSAATEVYASNFIPESGKWDFSPASDWGFNEKPVDSSAEFESWGAPPVSHNWDFSEKPVDSFAGFESWGAPPASHNWDFSEKPADPFAGFESWGAPPASHNWDFSEKPVDPFAGFESWGAPPTSHNWDWDFNEKPVDPFAGFESLPPADYIGNGFDSQVDAGMDFGPIMGGSFAGMGDSFQMIPLDGPGEMGNGALPFDEAALLEGVLAGGGGGSFQQIPMGGQQGLFGMGGGTGASGMDSGPIMGGSFAGRGGGMGGLGMLGGGGGGGLMQLAGACRGLLQNDAKVAEIQRDCLPGGVLSMGALQDCPAVPSGCRSALKSASPQTLASAMSMLQRMSSPSQGNFQMIPLDGPGGNGAALGGMLGGLFGGGGGGSFQQIPMGGQQGPFGMGKGANLARRMGGTFGSGAFGGGMSSGGRAQGGPGGRMGFGSMMGAGR